MIFFRKKYQEVLGKYEKSKEEIKKLNKLLLETNEIINDTIEEFKKECVKNSKEYYRDNARKPKELKK